MTEFIVDFGNWFGAITKSSMEMGGNIPNFLIIAGVVLGLLKSIQIIKAEKYEEA